MKQEGSMMEVEKLPRDLVSRMIDNNMKLEKGGHAISINMEGISLSESLPQDVEQALESL